MLIDFIHRFARHRAGTVSIIAALALPLLLGFISLAGEFGYGLVVKVENQRIADMASYAGALAYSSTSSTATMTAVAQNVAALNGIPAAQTNVSLVASPRTAGDEAVAVDVQRNDVLLLAPILRSGSTLPVASQADAQVANAPSACILALSGSGSGVTLSGGTSVSAASCSVSSNTTVSAPCGTSISAKSVSFNSGTPTQCNNISGSLIKQATADPLASNTAVAALQSHASSLSLLTTPSAPSGGTALEFGFSNQSKTQTALTAAGCTGSFTNSGGSWTVTCPNGGTYKFGGVQVDGGVTLKFAIGSTNAIFDFSGGITTGGGTNTTFGAGTFNIGPGSCSSSGGANFSICNTSTLTFGGPSTFVLSAGIFNSGGSTLTLGSGSTNSFDIGPSTGSGSDSGDAIWVGGGAQTTLADATGDDDIFQAVGNITAPNGGSCLTISAAAQHDIDGFLSTAGGLSLGTGVYSIYDYIAFGATNGGDVNCNGKQVGVSGTGVTLVTAAKATVQCSGPSGPIPTALCVGAGFSDVTLTAPTSGADANFVLIGPSTSANDTAAADFNEGSDTTLAGALYFPDGPLTLSGGASVGNQSGECLQVIASQISLSGGTHLTSNSCITAAGAAQVELVQ